MASFIKYDSSIPEHRAVFHSLPYSYSSCLPNLDLYASIFERNGEKLVVWQDDEHPQFYQSVFLPKSKKNWELAPMTHISSEDMVKIEAEGIPILYKRSEGVEYFFQTETFTKPTGDMARNIRRFERDVPFRVLRSYDPVQVIEFYYRWRSQKRKPSERKAEDNLTHPRRIVDPATASDEEFFRFCTEFEPKYDIRSVYIEINGELAGVAFGVLHSPGKWVGLHSKADYRYKGLSRVLLHERAKLFADEAIVSLSTAGGVPGLDKFKQELGPSHVIEYFSILTGQKQKVPQQHVGIDPVVIFEPPPLTVVDKEIVR